METLDRKKIGMNIKVRRMQKLISQTAMAEKLGISQTHMSNVEVGRAMLSLELLLQLELGAVFFTQNKAGEQNQRGRSSRSS